MGQDKFSGRCHHMLYRESVASTKGGINIKYPKDSNKFCPKSGFKLATGYKVGITPIVFHKRENLSMDGA